MTTADPGSNENLELDLAVANSITASGGISQLANGDATPGSAKFYSIVSSVVKDWQAAPAGADTQVQFNDSDSFAGNWVSTDNKTNKKLTVNGTTMTKHIREV